MATCPASGGACWANHGPWERWTPTSTSSSVGIDLEAHSAGVHRAAPSPIADRRLCSRNDPQWDRHDLRPVSAREWRYTRSEEHTSELQSLMRISYAVFCLKK